MYLPTYLSMTTKVDNEVHLEDLTQITLTKQVPRSRDKLKTLYLSYQTSYDYQTWQDDNLP